MKASGHVPLGWHELVELRWPLESDDEESVLECARRAAEAAGLSPLGHAAHTFAPHGVTVVLLLAESHASIHTWPERGTAMLDVFSCKSRESAETFTDFFVSASGAEILQRDVVARGRPG